MLSIVRNRLIVAAVVDARVLLSADGNSYGNGNGGGNRQQYNNHHNRYPAANNRPMMDTRKLQMNPQNVVSKETVLGPEIRTQWGTGCKSNGGASNGWNSVQA